MPKLTSTRLLGTLGLTATLFSLGCAAFSPFGADRTVSRVSARAIANPGVQEIDDPSGFSQVVAISDVHGMYDQARKILATARVIDAQGRWSAGKTLLVVVGDSIDKGPDTLDVLDMWLALSTQAKAAGGQVVHVLGNHEAEFLADPQGDSKSDELRAELQAKHVPLEDLTDPSHAHGAFLRQEPLALRVGRLLFLHAGLYPDMDWATFRSRASATLSTGRYSDSFLIGDDSPLEAKDWWKDPGTRSQLESRLTANGLFGVVQGHQPKAYGFKDQIGSIDGGRLIKIDCGIPPEAGSNPPGLVRFPHPAELAANRYPTAEVVTLEGTAPLQPGS